MPASHTEAFFVFMTLINVANAVIVNPEGQVLLTQRFDPKNKNIHMRWQVPGGGIEKNETPRQACVREAKEETGLTVEIISENPIQFNQEYPDVCFHLNVFLARAISGTINTELDEETNDAKWYEPENIKELRTLDDTYSMVNECLLLWKKH